MSDDAKWTIKLERTVDIEIPRVPNFIKVGGESRSVSTFTDKELESIGRGWTERLIDRAKDIQKYKNVKDEA
jgi:hypothetical protein